jgi:hypothetical protein
MESLSLLAEQAEKQTPIQQLPLLNKLNKLTKDRREHLRKQCLKNVLYKVLSEKNIAPQTYFKSSPSNKNKIKVDVFKYLIQINFEFRPDFVKHNLKKYANYVSKIYSGKQQTKIYNDIKKMYK